MLFGYFGYIGGGKSYHATFESLRRANDKKRIYISNQRYNEDYLFWYSKKIGWNWICSLLKSGNFITLTRNDPSPAGLQSYCKEIFEALGIRRSVVFLDECGLFFPYRRTAPSPVPANFYSDILLSRKGCVDLYYVSQDIKILDPFFASNSEFAYHCQSTPFANNLQLFTVWSFQMQYYQQWLQKPRNFLSSWLDYKGWVSNSISNPKWWKVYDSFSTLGANNGFKNRSVSSLSLNVSPPSPVVRLLEQPQPQTLTTPVSLVPRRTIAQ